MISYDQDPSTPTPLLASREKIVLLHGWGCDSRTWSPVLAQLQTLANVIAIDLPGFGNGSAVDNFSLDIVVDVIAAQLPDNCILIGWSLGGMLAVQIAVRYPHKVSRIITLATNVKFVANFDHPHAMPFAINQAFNKKFATDPDATLKLFNSLLAQGDANERTLLKKIRGATFNETINGTMNAHWLQALQLLAQLDNRTAFAALTQPGLHLLGEADSLVPVNVAPVLTALNTKQTIYVVPQAAHALHWSQPEKVTVLISEFLTDQLSIAPIEKKRIAQSFSRAAHTYDAVADLQRNVGENLLGIIKTDTSAEVVLDIGCGTGHFSQHIQQKFPHAKIIGIDLAEGMLAVAQAKNPNINMWLCGDAENLPIASASIDVIFSSLALQWCHNLSALFAELHRVLKPNGTLIFSTLGQNTLHELKSAWRQVDNYIHVNHFKTQHQICASLQNNHFSIVHFKQQSPTLTFAKITDLTRGLKALGAHNINRGQANGLTGRNKLAAFKIAYEKYRRNDLLPATYDVIYIQAQK